MDTLNTDKNIIQFADGEVVYIEDVKYSHNGLTHWEDTFNPNEHISTLDGVNEIGPHRYKKIKHSGDTEYQLPMKIIPDEIVLSEDGEHIYWKYEYDTEWKELIDLSTLKGDKGDKGDDGKEGQGLEVTYVGYYYDMPDCSSNLTSTCNECNPGTTSSINKPVTYLSVGDGAYKITSTDISNGNVSLGGSTYTHYSNDASNWIAISAALANQEVQYLAEDNSGLNAINLKNTDYQGSSGTVYVCVNNGWQALSSLEVANPTVKLNSGAATGKYLEDFVDGTYIDINSNEYFTITDNSITPSKVDMPDFAGNGIQVDGTQFAINVNDITDTNTGISYDGTHLYANTDDFDGFGLKTVGETAYLNDFLYVNSSDLIDGGGLTTINHPTITGAELLEVNDGDGIAIDGSGELIANIDGLTITTDNTGQLQVNEINGSHIDSNIAGNALEKDINSPYALHVVADETTITVDGSNDYIKVKDYGIDNTQLALNSVKDVNLDEIAEANFYIGQGTSTDVKTFAITGDVSIDKNGIATVVDVTDGSINEDHLKNLLSGDNGDILTSDGSQGFTWSTTTITEVDNHIAATDNPHGVTHIDVDSSTAHWNANKINGQTVDGTADAADQTLVYDGANIVWQATTASISSIGNLDDVNTSGITSGQILAYQSDGTFDSVDANAHNHTASDITDLVTALDGTFVELGTKYANAKVENGTGIILYSPDGSGFKLIVDDNGNLDTTAV